MTGQGHFDGVQGGFRRAGYKGCGYAIGQIQGRPHIGIANTYSEASPGHAHLRQMAESIKAGVWQAGGVPVEFGVPSTCGNMAIGCDSLRCEWPLRDLVAACVELVAQIHLFDGLVLTAGCDNIIPGMMLVAARLNLPTILFMGGPMLAGNLNESKVVLSDVNELVFGDASKREEGARLLAQQEGAACPTMGACPVMGTANTMQILAEAIGLTLPYNATIPAVFTDRLANAHQTGNRIVDMVKEGLRARDIITPESIENALRVDVTIGGSTNAVMHLLSLSREIGGILVLDDFDRISRETPSYVTVRPNGTHTADELHAAGGVPAILKQLAGKLHTNCKTASGGTIGELIEKTTFTPSDVIRDTNHPAYPDGGLAVLWGNLSQRGAIIRTSAMKLERQYIRGPAKVYDSDVAACQAMLNGDIQSGDVVVVRYAGPVGGAMVEVHMSADALIGLGLDKDVGIVTDGRFSGFNYGPIVGHVSPEAAVGGTIALVQDGDIVEIDIPSRSLTLKVDDGELARRKQAWSPPEPVAKTGFMHTYINNCLSADLGAAMQPTD